MTAVDHQDRFNEKLTDIISTVTMLRKLANKEDNDKILVALEKQYPALLKAENDLDDIIDALEQP